MTETEEARIAQLEHNVSALIESLVTLAAEVHTIRDRVPDGDTDAFRKEIEGHYHKILSSWKAKIS